MNHFIFVVASIVEHMHAYIVAVRSAAFNDLTYKIINAATVSPRTNSCVCACRIKINDLELAWG